MTLRADAAVVGGGPAGASAAVFLARQGLRVVLAEAARFPRPKACGEGVMPAALPVLAELGVLAEAAREGRPFSGLRLWAGGESVQAPFPAGRGGLVLARDRLDQLLLERAKAEPLVTVLEGCRAEGVRPGGFEAGGRAVRAPWVLTADGCVSAAARELGAPRRLPRRRRFGLRMRFEGVRALSAFVEVFFLDGAEIYLAPHRGPGDLALAAVLVEQGRYASFIRRPREAFMETLASCAELWPRLARAAQASPVLGMGPLGGSSRRWEGPGWLLVGDAASSLDPITGEGVALALENGRLAARHVAAALGGGRPGSYTRRRRRLLLRRRLTEAFLLALARRPGLRRAALRVFRRRPGLLTALLAGC